MIGKYVYSQEYCRLYRNAPNFEYTYMSIDEILEGIYIIKIITNDYFDYNNSLITLYSTVFSWRISS